MQSIVPLWGTDAHRVIACQRLLLHPITEGLVAESVEGWHRNSGTNSTVRCCIGITDAMSECRTDIASSAYHCTISITISDKLSFSFTQDIRDRCPATFFVPPPVPFIPLTRKWTPILTAALIAEPFTTILCLNISYSPPALSGEIIQCFSGKPCIASSQYLAGAIIQVNGINNNITGGHNTGCPPRYRDRDNRLTLYKLTDIITCKKVRNTCPAVVILTTGTLLPLLPDDIITPVNPLVQTDSKIRILTQRAGVSRILIPSRNSIRIVFIGLVNRQPIPLVQQMPGFDGDITILCFDIAGGVDHFAVGISRRISLHPQIVACEDIAALVGNGVGIKRQIICRVQQRRINDSARRIERQRTTRAGETID